MDGLRGGDTCIEFDRPCADHNTSLRHTDYTANYRLVQALVLELRKNKQFNEVCVCVCVCMICSLQDIFAVYE